MSRLAPQDGTLNVTAAGTNFDHYLTLATGPNLSALTYTATVQPGDSYIVGDPAKAKVKITKN